MRAECMCFMAGVQLKYDHRLFQCIRCRLQAPIFDYDDDDAVCLSFETVKNPSGPGLPLFVLHSKGCW